MSQRVAGGPILLSSDLVESHPLKAQLGNELLVLMVQRGFGAKRFPGLWTIPTGMVDSGEILRQTIAREAMEEFGVEVLGQAEHVHSGINKGVQIYYLRARQWQPTGDTPVLSKSPKGVIENIGFGFIPISEAIQIGEQHGLVFADALKKLDL